MMKVECAFCGKESDKPSGAVNRALKKNAPLYCNRVCAGLGRRKGKSDAEKREEKRLYDIEYRTKNRALLKTKKAAYFRRTYDPQEAAVKRKERMPFHVEYCRRPEYREYKRGYDRQHRAKKFYGPFWESFLLTMDIRSEALSRQSDYEIRLEKGTLCKTQRRKRDYEATRTHREELEVGPLGNLERGQRR
jgi:hypothetical protein